MHTMESLRDLLENELSEIVATGELDEHRIGCIDKIVDILKDLGEIEMSEMGYSEAGYRNSYRSGRRNGYSGRRSYRGYARNGYGMDGDMMGDLMSRAQNDEEREVIRRIMGI